MNQKEFTQLKSYATTLVYELHRVIFDSDEIFDRLKPTLHLAEELECEVMHIERRQKENGNVVPFKRIA